MPIWIENATHIPCDADTFALNRSFSVYVFRTSDITLE